MKLVDLRINLSNKLISLPFIIFNLSMKVGAQQIFTLVKDRRWPRTKKVLHEKSLECNK